MISVRSWTPAFSNYSLIFLQYAKLARSLAIPNNLTDMSKSRKPKPSHEDAPYNKPTANNPLDATCTKLEKINVGDPTTNVEDDSSKQASDSTQKEVPVENKESSDDEYSDGLR